MRLTKGNFFIGLGLLFLLAALLLTTFNTYTGGRADEAAREIVLELQVQIPDEPETTLPNTIPEREMPAIEVGEYRYIGTLEIPVLELVLPVMEECDDNRLKKSPCRYSGSFYQDNMVVAGHNYARHFRQLKNLPMESEIIFTDVEGNVYSYYVAWIENLQSEQIDEMVNKTSTPESNWDLTLFTCTTGGGSRYTLRCIRSE